ncbi:MAG TPA: RecQ family ATP-dependent DNA helicase, partial [Acidimicrobiia bacterium]|nr:RecQ family ATP-dependent DNA helicase [Acidimicrobiia bacterium]
MDVDRTELAQVASEHTNSALAAMAGEGARAHDDQLTAVEALVADHARVLVVQATGWGKSAVYWAATSAIRSLGGGPTLVVSPLLALMRDQIAAAERAGLHAVTVNSTNVDEWDSVLAAVDAGTVDVLLVSPERLANPGFARRVGPLVKSAGLVVIDEAHCISDWGFDFRPDYQRLSRVLTSVPDTPVLATTATANARVTTDVATQLGDATVVLRGGLARSSLRLSVVDGLSVLERYAWIDTALHTLAGSGIVYVPTVAETDRLADYLSSRGHQVAAYSGQLDTDTREQVEDALRANELKAVVATSALGMGYDKPDLGFCVHMGSPDSPVAYYQQVGRAGRAIEHAEAVLLPAETDERIWEYFATAAIPEERNVAPVLDALTHEGAPLSVPALEALTGIRRGRLEALLKVIAVDGAVERTTGGWIATGKPYVFDDEKWAAIRATREAEADLMRAYAGGRGCLMEFLQQALDDPDPGPCGRCSVCTGELPAPGRDLDPAVIDMVRQHLRGVDTVLEPRKRWPSGLATDHKGVIVGATHGRALTYADTPGWLDAVRALNAPDAPLPDEVFDGMVTVLTRWRTTWNERPVAVVPMPSRRHPVLVRDLAERL